MAHHATTWGLCSGRSWSWRGFVGAQYRQFCLRSRWGRIILCHSRWGTSRGQRACTPSVGNNGRATLCAQQLIPGQFAVYRGENAKHGVKFVAHFYPTNSRVGNAAALIEVDSSPRPFSHAGYFQVTGRRFGGYGRALTCTDSVSRHWRTHWPIIFLEGAAPRCRSSPNFRRNSRCTDTFDLLNTNCSTQNMRCCTDQRSIVHWIQGHKEPNHHCLSDPSHNSHKQYCQLKMGNVKCCTLYMERGMYTIVCHDWKFLLVWNHTPYITILKYMEVQVETSVLVLVWG